MNLINVINSLQIFGLPQNLMKHILASQLPGNHRIMSIGDFLVKNVQ